MWSRRALAAVSIITGHQRMTSTAFAVGNSGVAVRQALVKAINIGAPLYNEGKIDDCSNTYINTARLIIDSGATTRGELALLKAAVKEVASGDISSDKKAWVMRTAFDKILAGDVSEEQAGASPPWTREEGQKEWTVVDFTNGIPPEPEWMRMDDGVMGGVSRSGLSMDDEEKCLVFLGEVKTENNGGFASIRSATWRGWNFGSTGAKGVSFLAKGDGRTYKISIKMDSSFRTVTYEHDFKPRADSFQENHLNFADFKPTFRGRLVPDAPLLDASSIQQVGFMCSKISDSGGTVPDFQPGSFQLRIKTISAYTD